MSATPNDGTPIYWRPLGSTPATPYKHGHWYTLTGDIIRVADYVEYPTAGTILSATEIEWVLA